jgi:hypothetical protein
MRLGELLDRTFQIYRNRFSLFLGIAVTPVLVQMALSLLGWVLSGLVGQTTLSYATKRALQVSLPRLPMNVLWGWSDCVAWFAIVAATSAIYAGESPSLRSTFEECRSRWKSLLGISAQLSVAWFLVPAFLERLVFQHNALIAETATGRLANSLVFLMVGWAPQCAAFAFLCMTIPAWTLEKLPVFAALP